MHRPGGKGMGPGGGPGGPVLGDKANNFNESIKKLAVYCKRYGPAIIISMILAIVSSVFSLLGPNKLSEITNIITSGMMTGIDINAISKIGLFLATIYGLSFVFAYLQGFIMSTVSQRITFRLRTDITKKINRLPLSYFDSRNYGDTLSRVTNDIDTIGTSLNQSLSSIISGVFMFFGSLILMFYTNWIMTISGLLATFVGFSLMSVLIKKSQKYFMLQQDGLGKLNGHIEEVYAGHTVVKAYNAEDKLREEFVKFNENLYSSAWKAQFISGLMMPIMGFVGNLAYVVVCIVGAILAVRGNIEFGVIVAFMVYIRLFTQPLSTIAQAATRLQSTAAASERVFEFLEEDELSDESGKTKIVDHVKGDVSFKNVKFGYSKNKPVIKNFSADIKSGQKVAIVGPTGAGKTTLINLLMRFYELTDGSITLDGVDIADLTRENIHDLFGMVLQDTWLFEGTVRENIAYSKAGVTDDEIKKACKAVGLHHYIKSLPHGYDTILSDNSSLSSGQKQLVTIARAMIENAPMLILDEATSSVDTRTEILIQEAMDKLAVGRTSFIIAHRLSTIKNADIILVLKDGDIIETGNHDELIKKGGFYADLYNSQFDNQ